MEHGLNKDRDSRDALCLDFLHDLENGFPVWLTVVRVGGLI